jgi:hypothetical protein
MVLDRPEIPLHTNGSENDIRCHVTRRKLSGGTRSDLGGECLDAFLSLAKTCAKLKIAFWDYLGDRLADVSDGSQSGPSRRQPQRAVDQRLSVLSDFVPPLRLVPGRSISPFPMLTLSARTGPRMEAPHCCRYIETRARS